MQSSPSYTLIAVPPTAAAAGPLADLMRAHKMSAAINKACSWEPAAAACSLHGAAWEE